jgi:hypothetical protein
MGQFKDWTRLGKGILSFHLTGKQQEKAYQAMIGLFCRTGGWSNDVVSSVIQFLRPKANFSLNEEEKKLTESWAETLGKDGIVPLGNYLKKETCEDLERWARTTPAVPKPDRPGLAKTLIPNPENPDAEGYYFLEQDLVSNLHIQRLMTDPKLLSLAQNYLGCEPILSIVAMWWSCAGKFSGDAARALAQMYHFDMDRPKWLKIFFYLTDVEEKNGPHVFVRKTHRTGFIPRELLDRGYARLTDEEVSQHFSEKEQMRIVGSRGSTFAEVTRGLHKGLIPENKYRLVLQLEFCNSLFGSEYERSRLNLDTLDKKGLSSAKKHPRIYRKFLPS